MFCKYTKNTIIKDCLLLNFLWTNNYNCVFAILLRHNMGTSTSQALFSFILFTRCIKTRNFVFEQFLR